MSGLDRVAVALLIFCFGPFACLAAAAPLPDEPRVSGTLLLPGRLVWGASALPTGEILAPCEDQSLSVLDEKASVVAQWRASARFSAPVTVGPRGPLQLTAAPLITGRVEILGWDPRTRVLASQFAAVHSAEATATAWGTHSLTLAWKDGHIETWSFQGERQWSAEAGMEVQWLLADENSGVYAFGQNKAVLFDHRGGKAASWDLAGRPQGVLQTMAGDLYSWGTSGLWRKRPGETKFSLFDPSPNLLGVTADRQDRLVVTEPGLVRRLAPDGTVLSVIVLPRAALTASVLDDRGRVILGTAAGIETWAYDGRFLGLVDGAPVSSFLLTEKGQLVWSDAQWNVHIWSGFHSPPFGWSQVGGGAGRPFSARGPVSVASRTADWANDVQFGYLYDLAASGEQAKQSQVLDLFEAKAAGGTLLSTWPFANVILLKVARSGLTDLLMNSGRVTNNWPELRQRALALLAITAAPEDRGELLDLLHREFDPAVVSQGVRALARSGWDGDGRLMRQLYELRGRMSDQSSVVESIIDSARILWLANGRSSDPILVPLVTAIYQGPYSRAIKLKAQNFFQDLVEEQ